MKKFIFLIAAIFAANILQAQNASGKLTVWSFTDEVTEMINNYFQKNSRPPYRVIQIEYSLTQSDQFENKLDPVLASGNGTPDVITLESSFVRKYVESGLLLDLTDIYEANKNKLLAYPVEVGTYNGRVYALSWQATPGAMFYRRRLAQKYLGTDDPAAVQTYFSNPGKFLETAKILKEKSGGKCVVISSPDDLFIPFLGARTRPWVVNGKLEIDPAMENYMDICKTLYDNRLDGKVGQWSEGWFDGMRGELRDAYWNSDENLNTLEVFSYFMPPWGLRYVLKINAPQTSGDWAMIPGPAPYYWGGTWLGAWKNTQNPNAAKEFIRYLTTDNGFLQEWALNTGDFVANTEVVNKIKNNYSEPFLAGQNQYAAFADIAKNINGKLEQKTDQVIEEYFREAATCYAFGEKTKAQALSDFRKQVTSKLDLK